MLPKLLACWIFQHVVLPMAATPPSSEDGRLMMWKRISEAFIEGLDYPLHDPDALLRLRRHSRVSLIHQVRSLFRIFSEPDSTIKLSLEWESAVEVIRPDHLASVVRDWLRDLFDRSYDGRFYMTEEQWRHFENYLAVEIDKYKG